jgi:hypothetical protein
MFRTIFHKDHTVTVWNVYTQEWLRHAARNGLSDRVLASLSEAERSRIERHWKA